jgi:hypothetical protein
LVVVAGEGNREGPARRRNDDAVFFKKTFSGIDFFLLYGSFLSVAFFVFINFLLLY